MKHQWLILCAIGFASLFLSFDAHAESPSWDDWDMETASDAPHWLITNPVDDISGHPAQPIPITAVLQEADFSGISPVQALQYLNVEVTYDGQSVPGSLSFHMELDNVVLWTPADDLAAGEYRVFLQANNEAMAMDWGGEAEPDTAWEISVFVSEPDSQWHVSPPTLVSLSGSEKGQLTEHCCAPGFTHCSAEGRCSRCRWQVEPVTTVDITVENEVPGSPYIYFEFWAAEPGEPEQRRDTSTILFKQTHRAAIEFRELSNEYCINAVAIALNGGQASSEFCLEQSQITPLPSQPGPDDDLSDKCVVDPRPEPMDDILDPPPADDTNSDGEIGIDGNSDHTDTTSLDQSGGPQLVEPDGPGDTGCACRMTGSPVKSPAPLALLLAFVGLLAVRMAMTTTRSEEPTQLPSRSDTSP